MRNPPARNPPAIVHNRKKFPYGAAVSINGKHFDKEKWPHKRQAPTLLGIIQNPFHHDGKEAETIDEKSEAFVTFVVSGHYKWKETAMLNTVSGKYKKHLLKIISFPPRDTKPMKYRGKTDPLRHFVKGHGKWDLRNHKNPCMDCGSPWCEYKKHKKDVEKIVSDTKTQQKEEELTNKEARYKCYVLCANVAFDGTEPGYRMRLGWCIENIVRTTFPEENPSKYTGFRYGEDMRPYEGDSSDSDVLYDKNSGMV